MKTKILLSIICACSLFAVKAQEWGYDNAFQREVITNIWTQGLDTVFVVGENGLIAKSTDRGNTWSKQYYEYGGRYYTLTDIFFCDPQNGFVIGEGSLLLKTTDRGDTWEKKEFRTYSMLSTIAYTGLDIIWMVIRGTVFHSTDYGETWNSAIDIDQDKYYFLSIAFKDDIGYIAGGSPAVLYKTEDKGQTWIKQLTDDRYSGSNFHSLCLTDNKAYMCLGAYPNSLSLYQSDDYQHWDETPLGGISPRGIFFLNDTVGCNFDTKWSGGG